MTCEVVVDIENDDYSGYKAHLPQGPYKYDELNEVQQLAIAVDCYWKMANEMNHECKRRRQNPSVKQPSRSVAPE